MREMTLRLVGAPNESLIVIIIYYMFKYSVSYINNFVRVTSETSYKELVFARNNFLGPVGAPNESLILIIIYYIFKYSVGIKQLC